MSETMVRLPRGGLAELCRVDMAGRWWLMPAVPYAGNRLLKRLSVQMGGTLFRGEDETGHVTQLLFTTFGQS